MSRYQLNEEMRVKYSNRLDNQIVSKVQIGPVQQRKCTDIVCLILFVLFVITFIVFLVYFLVNGGPSIKTLKDNYDVQFSANGMGQTFVKSSGTIVGMIALSCVLSIIFIVLCAKFPKCVVISGIIFTFLCYLAIIVLAFAMKQWVLAFVMIAVAMINAIMLYCWRDQIKVGIALLKASGAFMIQKPSIAAIGIISLLINIVFLVFYILGWLSAYTQTIPSINFDESSRNRYSGMMVFFIFMGIYLGYFLYYLMVFVLSTAVAYWYYQQPKHILYGYKTISKHVGSLALASLIITIIVILRRAAQRQFENSDNLCLKVVWCFVVCIMRCIQGFVEVLNHNSIIVMSLTGENFISSAKTTLGIIYNNFPLFWIVDFIADFIQFYSLILCILAPSIIGGVIIWKDQKVEDTAVIGGVIIFLLSWIVTSVILGLLYEALSAVFIIFCLDKKLRERGFINGNVPQEIKHLFNDYETNDNFTIAHMKELKPQTQTNFAKDPQNRNANMDSDTNFVSKEPAKKTRKRKLNRKQGEKKVDDRSEDNKSDIAQDDIQMDMQDNYKSGISKYPLRKGNDLDENNGKKGASNPKSQNLHPYYFQQKD